MLTALRFVGRGVRMFALIPLIPFIFIAILIASIDEDPYEDWS